MIVYLVVHQEQEIWKKLPEISFEPFNYSIGQHGQVWNLCFFLKTDCIHYKNCQVLEGYYFNAFPFKSIIFCQSFDIDNQMVTIIQNDY
jgi:hypothetical protein